jgi:hypothetical protein
MANIRHILDKVSLSNWFFPLILCLAVFACYANSLTNSFVSDDCYLIQLNRDKPNLQGFITSFTTCDYILVGCSQPYYRPLAKLVYLLEHSLFGLNPSMYHAVNIALHTIATILLYLTLLRLKCTRLPSLAASLLFAVHPVNAEAVNLIVALNNILATIFVLGSFLIFLSSERSGKRVGYFLSGFLFFLGLLSKETALMLIPLLFYLKTLRCANFSSPRKLLRVDLGYLLPHLTFLMLYIPLRLIALDTATNLSGLTQRLWDIIYIIPKYLSLVVFPSNLAFGYPIPRTFTPDLWWLIPGWATMAAAAVYLFKSRNSTIEFGVTWLIFNFLPISNVIPISSGPGPMADRFLYIPLIGLAVIIADRLDNLSKSRISNLAAIFIVSLATGFSLFTVKRNLDWKDSLAFAEALVRGHRDAESHFELGYERYLRGKPDLAQKSLEISVALDTRHREASWAYYYLAVLCLERDDDRQAVRYLVSAEQANNVMPSPHYLLGFLYGNTSQKEAASRENNLFLWSVMPSSSHLIPEVNDRELEACYRVPRRACPAEIVSITENWKQYHRFAGGTELYYDPSSIRWHESVATVSARHILGRRDRLRYAIKFIKYPLATAAEVRYDFELKCPEHLYKTVWCDFRDRYGNITGAVDTQREDFVKYLYPLPGTPMQTLFQEVCGRQAVAINPL